jgi:hypothetical protein
MTSWHSYPKIFALGHRAISELFFDAVLIEEKIDGSQFSFGRFNGELKCKSKGADLNIEYPEKMFSQAVKEAEKLDLTDGWTYRAEYLQKPKHNSLAYNRVPEKHLIIFDINTSEEKYLSYDDKKKEAERIGLEIVPIIYLGKIDNAETLTRFLETDSILGGQKIEGMVIKNYNRFGVDKHVLMGKYVSEKFKEIHRGEWRKSNPTKTDILQFLINKYKTPARWEKAIQHLNERGELTNTPKDIGSLLKEIQTDTENECIDEIKSTLYNNFIANIKRGIVAGFPEYYKERLMKNQFGGDKQNDN